VHLEVIGAYLQAVPFQSDTNFLTFILEKGMKSKPSQTSTYHGKISMSIETQK
jgi:hypothetical protein